MIAAEVLEGEGNALAFPFWVASRRKFEPHDPFFAAGNIERELLAKQVALDLDGDEKYEVHNMEDVEGLTLFCPIVGCGARLKSLEDFEDHYHARHTASCSVCWRVYPTSRLLSIHVSEAHDSFFQAKVARGFPMYECLVEGCGLKLKSYQSRQQHLVDKHKFPSSFEFFRKAHPSKHQRQKHQRKLNKSQQEDNTDMEMAVEGNSSKKGVYRYQGKQPSHKGGERKKMEVDLEGRTSKGEMHKYQKKQVNNNENGVKDTKMEVDEKVGDLISAVSKLSTSESTPSSINFGHRHSQAFTFLPRSVQRNKKLANPADTNG